MTQEIKDRICNYLKEAGLLKYTNILEVIEKNGDSALIRLVGNEGDILKSFKGMKALSLKLNREYTFEELEIFSD